MYCLLNHIQLGILDITKDDIGGIIIRMLQFSAQYLELSKKFKEVIELLVSELEKRGISLPK